MTRVDNRVVEVLLEQGVLEYGPIAAWTVVPHLRYLAEVYPMARLTGLGMQLRSQLELATPRGAQQVEEAA